MALDDEEVPLTQLDLLEACSLTAYMITHPCCNKVTQAFVQGSVNGGFQTVVRVSWGTKFRYPLFTSILPQFYLCFTSILPLLNLNLFYTSF